MSKMTYARLLIPELFPATVSKVLYLDSDLLALGDLGPLWRTDLAGAVVAAVPDFYYHTKFVLEGLDPEVTRAQHAGLPPVRDYLMPDTTDRFKPVAKRAGLRKSVCLPYGAYGGP
jgi:hypothetical protein